MSELYYTVENIEIVNTNEEIGFDIYFKEKLSTCTRVYIKRNKVNRLSYAFISLEVKNEKVTIKK